jgi:hypothetical protein
MRIRVIVAAFGLAASLLLFSGCNNKRKTETQTVDPLEHVDPTRHEPNHFLHKTFQLKKNAQFSFVVPPHSTIPHLQGTFTAFLPKPGDEPLSDDTTNVDFLLLSPDQYSEFTNGNMNGGALYSTGPTHSHEVDYSLSPTIEEPATYFVVFRNPGGVPVKSVKADFSVTYGY